MYFNEPLFKLVSTSSNTSSNSDHANKDLQMDLYRIYFISLIYYLLYHGSLERLNFQIIFSLLKKSWNFLFLLILFSYFALVLKAFAFSEYVFGFPLLEINHLKLLINSVVLKFDTSSRCTVLLTLQENNKMYALILPLDL